MVRKTEYDFFNWTSFPSSLKQLCDEPGERAYAYVTPNLAVRPGSVITYRMKIRQENVVLVPENVSGESLALAIVTIRKGDPRVSTFYAPWGNFNWTPFEHSLTAPPEGTLRATLTVPGGVPGEPAIAWIDDLKIYQDGVLIYSNDFSNWNPMIGAGVGAPIGGVAGYLLKEPLGPMVSEVVGAVVGGALGGGVGLLTGLGIIPVPQIPALGAAPEGPGAPMRLGKYQITG